MSPGAAEGETEHIHSTQAAGGRVIVMLACNDVNADYVITEPTDHEWITVITDKDGCKAVMLVFTEQGTSQGFK